MDLKKDRSAKCHGDYETADASRCPNCMNSLQNELTLSNVVRDKVESVKFVKPLESSYVAQIASIGVRSDNVYEAQMLLAPEVDMSSIKITVKANNLRVTVQKPLSDGLVDQLPEIVEKSALGDLVKKTVKHRENLLIPETIDGDKVRAVVDNKRRLLILTAPTMKPSKARRKLIVRQFQRNMEKLPQHCQQNATILKQNDYANFETMSAGVKTSCKFNKVPDFYNIDEKQYFAAEMKIEGLKVATAALAAENVLNIKLYDSEGQSQVRNLNFFIPPEANAKKVSVEIFNNLILVRAPLNKRNSYANLNKQRQ